MDMPVIDAVAVDRAITSRRSIGRFLPTPVPAATVEAILDVAARAPSGTNMQPWRGYVLAGAAKDALIEAVQAVFDAQESGHAQEVQYYPDAFFEPYLSRRRAVGWDSTAGWASAGEAAKMKAQHRRNFQFFDAPVGMIFTIDRRSRPVLAGLRHVPGERHDGRARPGLDTCAQAAWRPTIASSARSGAGGRGNRRLRHGAGLCRPGRAGEHVITSRAPAGHSCGSTDLINSYPTHSTRIRRLCSMPWMALEEAFM